MLLTNIKTRIMKENKEKEGKKRVAAQEAAKSGAESSAKMFKRLKDIKVTKTKDPKEMVGKYLVKNVTRSWTENLVDEDTGEVVPLEQYEVLFRATPEMLTASDVSQIQFFLKSYDDADAVEVSDEYLPRVDLRGYSGGVPMLLKLHYVCEDAVYGVRAKSLEDAIAICTNYGALYCDLEDTVYVVSMKMLGCPVYGDEDKEALNAALEKEYINYSSDPSWYGYYKVDGLLKYYDMALDKKKTVRDSVVVLAREVGEAKEKGLKALEEQWKYIMKDAGDPQSSVQKVSPVRIDWMVPEWYSKEWYEKEKEEQAQRLTRDEAASRLAPEG